MDREELERAILSCAECRSYLLGNPHIPGDIGAMKRIESHLININDKVQKHEVQINRIFIFLALSFGGGVGAGFGVEKFIGS